MFVEDGESSLGLLDTDELLCSLVFQKTLAIPPYNEQVSRLEGAHQGLP